MEGYFDPNATMYFVMSCFGVLMVQDTLGELGVRMLSAPDVILWLWLWVSIDYRSFEAYWNGLRSTSYDWFTTVATVLLISGYTSFRGGGVGAANWELEGFAGFGYRLIPHWIDLLVAFGGLLFIGVLAIPIGLSTGFLQFAQSWPSFIDVLTFWTENYLTVAIHEELFFRGILLTGIARLFTSSSSSTSTSSDVGIGRPIQRQCEQLLHLMDRFGEWFSRHQHASVLHPEEEEEEDGGQEDSEGMMLGTNIRGKKKTMIDRTGWWIGLEVSSVMFGLMHLPRREGEPIQQFLYAFLAYISAHCYALAYRYSYGGWNICGAALAHSFTDTVWEYALKN
jgi:membrane protease YdiL (CAAX protease family)